ncbi:hypothetical protein L226DRAFT_539455 [Lentinus tigrinus ALCF2SS1-7]|uniref:uncharacterized protein n=1 Tax=Lentinus tigrinus ALCF2SS1-7 TaxID=1328758 RepID=UPI001165E7B5|nr:hypothetical protein L226DRAFT_539455 [Lentinus tigrinus ALCF2SS1-7]
MGLCNPERAFVFSASLTGRALAARSSSQLAPPAGCDSHGPIIRHRRVYDQREPMQPAARAACGVDAIRIRIPGRCSRFPVVETRRTRKALACFLSGPAIWEPRDASDDRD